MAKVLTDRIVKSLKPDTRQYDVRDAALPGLAIRVNADGTKTWSITISRGGRRQRMKLGRYPDLSLSDARLRGTERKLAGPRVGGSVESVFTVYLDEIRKSHRAWRDVEQVGRLYMLPLMGTRDMDAITAADGVEMMDLIRRKSSDNRSAKAIAYLRPFFRWAAGRSIIPTNPWAVIVPPSNTTEARERVLTDNELAAVWNFAKTDTYPFGPFLQMLILTAQRRAEVGGIAWAELDLERALWTIPAARHKQKRGHEIPLTAAALGIITSLPRHCDWLYSTTRRSPISGFGKFKQRIDKATGVGNWRLHDLRRTAATRMAEMQVPRFTVARVLGHSDTAVTAIYDRANYRAEKLEALVRWEQFVVDLEGRK